jgi:hypothetical protein
MKSKSIRTFDVSGCGHFPIDMLRYDECWPATEQDSTQLANYHHTRIVTLKTIYSAAPTDGRWASFGWTVIPSV